MGLVKINVFKRTESGKNENRRTRAAGFTPAVIYGADREATMLQLETKEFTKIMKKTGGGSVIFDLSVEGEEDHPIALMKEIQAHPVTDVIFHVDLFEIPRGVPVTVEVPVVFDGEPACVKIEGATVLQTLNSVEVSCLPRELPEQIVLDVSELEMNDKLYVKDLVTPAGEIITDEETQVLVVKAAAVFVEDEEAEGEEGAEGAEGEEGAEGGEGDSPSED